jgi:hypothetical protein
VGALREERPTTILRLAVSYSPVKLRLSLGKVAPLLGREPLQWGDPLSVQQRKKSSWSQGPALPNLRSVGGSAKGRLGSHRLPRSTSNASFKPVERREQVRIKNLVSGFSLKFTLRRLSRGNHELRL